MLNKSSRLNALVKIIISTLVIIFIGIAATLIILNSPFYREDPWQAPTPGETYTFENWQIHFNHLDIYFPEGKAILGLNNGELSGLVIKGEGRYDVDIQAGAVREDEGMNRSGSLEAIHIPVDENKLETLKGDVIFRPSDKYLTDIDREKAYGEYFKVAKDYLVSLDTFAFSRVIPPRDESAAVYLFGYDYDASYYEAEEVIFSTTTGEKFAFDTTAQNAAYPPANFYFSTASYLLIYLAILLLMITIFTIDFYAFEKPKSLFSTYTALFIIILISISGLFLKWLQFELGFSYWLTGAFYLLLTGIIFSLQIHKASRFQFIGFSFAKWGKKLFLTLVLAILMLGLESLQLPAGISLTQLKSVTPGLLTMLLVVLLRELILRGFLISALENFFSMNKSLLISVLIIGVIHTSLYYATEVSIAFGPSINAFLQHVILPIFAAAFFGFLYQRTRNILCPVLVQAWVWLGEALIVF